MNEITTEFNAKIKKIGEDIGTFCTNSSKWISDMCNGVLKWILGKVGVEISAPPTSKDDDAIYNDKGVSYNSNKYSNNTSIVNNFGSLPTGKRITWDYENSQFWV
jgi:hypothetical protein